MPHPIYLFLMNNIMLIKLLVKKHMSLLFKRSKHTRHIHFILKINKRDQSDILTILHLSDLTRICEINVWLY